MNVEEGMTPEGMVAVDIFLDSVVTSINVSVEVKGRNKKVINYNMI